MNNEVIPQMFDEAILVEWRIEQGLKVCREVEAALINTKQNWHVALGGSVLHKGESSKDLDLFFYPHKTTEPRDVDTLLTFLSQNGFKGMNEAKHSLYGDSKRVYCSTFENKRVDLFLLQ